ncbi:Zinc finger protein [Musa troglodytarum]|uniref:Zinc finger protein n=1 Tax=Musa troglodytarum TaxID=320322 RepID=A0A9E7I045_9LILI|nr:Zinc finger protein [Musa troglodytarum]
MVRRRCLTSMGLMLVFVVVGLCFRQDVSPLPQGGERQWLLAHLFLPSYSHPHDLSCPTDAHQLSFPPLRTSASVICMDASSDWLKASHRFEISVAVTFGNPHTLVT